MSCGGLAEVGWWYGEAWAGLGHVGAKDGLGGDEMSSSTVQGGVAYSRGGHLSTGWQLQGR